MPKTDAKKEITRLLVLIEKQAIEEHKADGMVLFKCKKIERLRKQLIAIESASCAALNLLASTKATKKPCKAKKKKRKLKKASKKPIKRLKTGKAKPLHLSEEFGGRKQKPVQTKEKDFEIVTTKTRAEKIKKFNETRQSDPSERMKEYWRKRKAKEAGEEPEDTDESTDDDTDNVIDEGEEEDSTKRKFRENRERLDKLQGEVQEDLKQAISFNAQKALAAMKKGATKLGEIAKESKLNYSGLNHILAELEEKGLITKVSFGTYALINEPKENGNHVKERD